MATRMDARVEALEKAMEELNIQLGAMEDFQRAQFAELRQLLTASLGGISAARNMVIGENNTPTQLTLQQKMELPCFEGNRCVSAFCSTKDLAGRSNHGPKDLEGFTGVDLNVVIEEDIAAYGAPTQREEADRRQAKSPWIASMRLLKSFLNLLCNINQKAHHW